MTESELTAHTKAGLRDMLAKAHRRPNFGALDTLNTLRWKVSRARKDEPGICEGYLWHTTEADTETDLQLWLTSYCVLYWRTYGAAPSCW